VACTKQQSFPGTASLTLINAVPNSTPSLVTNFSGTDPIVYYKSALKLVYGTADKTNQSLAYTGEQPLAIYRYPDTLAHSTPLYNLTLELQSGTIYTLFLTGTLAAPDTMMTIDNPPYHPLADSSLSIRFVNLSPGSTPVSVNVTGSPNGTEVGSLGYKNMTGFKSYTATSTVSHYNFEFRDAATGTLLTSYDLTGINTAANNARRYRNFTLAYLGLPGDATTRKITLVETYTSN
jgi:hypothetical protein